MRSTNRRWLYRTPRPGIVLFVIAAVAVVGFVVQRLWNWLIPAIVGWHAITFWQAMGILLLSKILFGSFRGGSRAPLAPPNGRAGGKGCLLKSGTNLPKPCGPAVALATFNLRNKRSEAWNEG